MHEAGRPDDVNKLFYLAWNEKVGFVPVDSARGLVPCNATANGMNLISAVD
jgi:hypothetical protein